MNVTKSMQSSALYLLHSATVLWGLDGFVRQIGRYILANTSAVGVMLACIIIAAVQVKANCKYCHNLFGTTLHAAPSTYGSGCLTNRMHGVQKMTNQFRKINVIAQERK